MRAVHRSGRYRSRSGPSLHVSGYMERNGGGAGRGGTFPRPSRHPCHPCLRAYASAFSSSRLAPLREPLTIVDGSAHNPPRAARGSVIDSDLFEVSIFAMRAVHRSGRYRSRSGPHFTFRVTWREMGRGGGAPPNQVLQAAKIFHAKAQSSQRIERMTAFSSLRLAARTPQVLTCSNAFRKRLFHELQISFTFQVPLDDLR